MKKARINILGIDIDPLTMQRRSIQLSAMYEGSPMGVDADKINQCHDDEEIRKIVNESGIISRWASVV